MIYHQDIGSIEISIKLVESDVFEVIKKYTKKLYCSEKFALTDIVIKPNDFSFATSLVAHSKPAVRENKHSLKGFYTNFFIT